MIIAILIGLVLAAAAVTLLARAWMMPRVRMAENIGRIDDYGFQRAPVTEEEAGRPLTALLDRIAGAAGGLLAGRLSDREEDVRKDLRAAGMYGTTPRRFTGYRMLSALGFPALWLWFSGALGYPRGLAFLGIFVAVFVGWMAPRLFVRRRARGRLAEVDHSLPELIDLLVVMVEAGLGFNGALQMSADRLEGPLGDELRLTLQEQRMGLGTSESLQNLLDRCDTAAMRSFVRSVIQGEQLGVSIGQVLRSLTLEMRKRRRATAEERAQKAPIKILFPLVFLIFPAMFVVLLGPAIFQILEAF